MQAKNVRRHGPDSEICAAVFS